MSPTASVDLDPVMRAFAAFLRESVPIVRPLARASDDPGFLDDWIQANWEALVEAALPRTLAIRLRVYGDGAACGAVGGRITERGVGETHHVVCRPRAGAAMLDALTFERLRADGESTVFERFVATGPSVRPSLRSGAAGSRGCAVAPPFDHVLVALPGGSAAAAPIDGVGFELSRSLDAMPRRFHGIATTAAGRELI